MLTRRYPRLTGEYFTYSYALVFTNRFWTMILAGLLMIYISPKKSQTTVIYEYSFSAISNMMSSWCQYEALKYVSFPASTLFKSFKLVPVMVMGKVLGNKACKYQIVSITWPHFMIYLCPSNSRCSHLYSNCTYACTLFRSSIRLCSRSYYRNRDCFIHDIDG